MYRNTVMLIKLLPPPWIAIWQYLCLWPNNLFFKELFPEINSYECEMMSQWHMICKEKRWEIAWVYWERGGGSLMHSAPAEHYKTINKKGSSSFYTRTDNCHDILLAGKKRKKVWYSITHFLFFKKSTCMYLPSINLGAHPKASKRGFRWSGKWRGTDLLVSAFLYLLNFLPGACGTF